MNLLIVEPEATGHRMALYVRLVAREALARNWGVTLLTTKSAVRHPGFATVRSLVSSGLCVSFMKSLPPLHAGNSVTRAYRNFAYLNAIQSHILDPEPDHTIDHVYIANLDYLILALGTRNVTALPLPYSGLLMAPAYYDPQSGIGEKGWKTLIYGHLLRRVVNDSSLSFIGVVDKVFYKISTSRKIQENKIRYIPEPGQVIGEETKAEARRHFSIDERAFVVLVYGSLTHRKGIDLLFDAIAMTRSSRSIIVLLSGLPDANVEHFLEGARSLELIRQERLQVRLGFQSATDEYLAFRCSDIVWLGYRGKAARSSGVLYQAASIGLPVISCKSGLLGSLVRENDVGIAVNPNNTAQTAAAISQLSQDHLLYRRMSRAAILLSDTHSEASFSSAICDNIQPEE